MCDSSVCSGGRHITEIISEVHCHDGTGSVFWIMLSCHLVKQFNNTNVLVCCMKEQWSATAATFDQWFLLVVKQGHCCFLSTVTFSWYNPYLAQWYFFIIFFKTSHIDLKCESRQEVTYSSGSPAAWQAEISLQSVILQDTTRCHISLCPNISTRTKTPPSFRKTKELVTIKGGLKQVSYDDRI